MLPFINEIGWSAWHRTARGLLHSRSAFVIRLPLTARDRRHLGCGCSSVVEHDLAKVGVEGSSPFARSRFSWYLNYFRQAAERRLFRFDPGGATNELGTAPSRHRFVRSDVTSALRFQWKPQVSSKRYDRVFRQTGSRSSALSQPQVQCATPGSAVYPTAHNSQCYRSRTVTNLLPVLEFGADPTGTSPRTGRRFRDTHILHQTC